jgi:ABC-type Zn2+ transport system substrate-binding protein/surface adhesin
MGYSCPVCGAPQHDDEHLANHLAMTAMLHGEDHEAWLDDHLADWSEHTPPELAAEIVEDAEEIDYDEATSERADIPTEDADSHDHTHDHAGAHDHAGGHPTEELADPAEVPDSGFLDEAAEAVVAEAREMTEKRREKAAEGGEDDGSPTRAAGEDDGSPTRAAGEDEATDA